MAKKKSDESVDFQEKEVSKKDLVTVYGTGLSKHIKQHKAHKVHSVVAEKLIERGFATSTKTE